MAIICILGALWFDQNNGNTYHNTKIKVIENDNKTEYATTYYTGKKYGYDNAYIESAHDYIKNVLHISDYKLIDMGALYIPYRQLRNNQF